MTVSPVDVGVWVKVKISFRVGGGGGGNQTFTPRKIDFRLGFAVSFAGVGRERNFPWGQLS